MAEAKRDENHVPVMLGENSVDGTPIEIQINPSTGGLQAEL